MRTDDAMTQFTVASLFSGCGGLDLGFEAAGFKIVFACDNDPAAVSVYNSNLEAAVAERLDVQTALFERRLSQLSRADVVLGGFPCQGFSKAGPKNEHDVRNVLYREMLRAVEVIQPQLFIAENVDGLFQNFSGRYRTQIHDDFQRLGYRVESRILDAVAFGVPQHRRRIFFVGMKGTLNFLWPQASHSSAARNGERRLDVDETLWDSKPRQVLPPPRSIRDAIGDLVSLERSDVRDHAVTRDWPTRYHDVFSAIREGQKLCNVRHSHTSVYTWCVPSVFGTTTDRQRHILETIAKHRRHRRFGTIPNGNPIPISDIEALTGLDHIESDITLLVEKGFLKPKLGGFELKGAMFCSGLFKRPRWDEPSPTILTNFHNPRYFLHPSEHRPFSLRECARLQGFPDSFNLMTDGSVKSLVDGYRLVGNAVPPPLARRLAEAVLACLSGGHVLAEAAS